MISPTSHLKRHDPVVFWRDRWHWPWWSAEVFDQHLESARRTMLGASELAASRELKFVYYDAPHPRTWLVQIAASRIGHVARIVAAEGDGLRTSQRPGLNGDELVDGEPDRLLLCANFGEDAASPELYPVRKTDGLVPVVQLEEKVRQVAEADLPLPARGRRPIVLLPSGSMRPGVRELLRWGAPRRACWLFGAAAEDWFEDLLWARPHGALAGGAELRVFARRLCSPTPSWWTRRRVRRDLDRVFSRLQWLAIEPGVDLEAEEWTSLRRGFAKRGVRIQEFGQPASR